MKEYVGSFYILVAVSDSKVEQFEDVRMLVDTGAAWTWVPRDILDRLGHRPTVKRRLQTADKRIIERDAGMVTMRIGEEALATLTIFGDEGSIPLLGGTTLQQFSVAPDPVNERLVPVVGVLATLLN
ncbi:MAG: retroviral-like aspartic protease family protein [Gaiellales bacterium]